MGFINSVIGGFSQCSYTAKLILQFSSSDFLMTKWSSVGREGYLCYECLSQHSTVDDIEHA